jgi:alkylation response protein AidB-like acyl-CoA dehydrogenase
MAELNFAGSRVPDENRLGELGNGYKLALSFLNVVRSAVPFVCAGVAQACIDASVKFARERVQFKRPIGSFQLIQAKIADMVTLTDAMRLLGHRAAVMVERGVPCQTEVSMAKLFASEAVVRIAENAMQIHGAYGYVRDLPIERYYRDIRYFTVADGTSEMHRLIIGRGVLGISAFN